MPSINEALDAYFAERSTELSESSLRNHHYQLKQFRLWARGAGEINSIADLDPIDLSRFRRARSSDLNSNTMYNQLCVLRLFLRFAHRMGWCEEQLPESIVLPSRAGRARDSSIDPDRVKSILDELERYEYASLDHVILSLLWTCSLRIGGARAIDIEDLHLDEGWVRLAHRPETGTPLKNKTESEREVNLHGWVCDVLRAWVDDRRPNCTDDYGREPLLTVGGARLSRTSVRRHVYLLTDCGGVMGDCACSDRSSQCDASVSPHDIRRSSISAWLDNGIEPALLSQRVDTSPDTMARHYDVRSATQKRELRRDAFDM